MNTPWTVAPAEDGVLTTCRRPASRRRLRADLLSGVSAVAFITAALCAQPSLAAAPAATNRAQDVARSLLNLNRAEQTIRAQLAGRDVARALRVMQHQSVYNGLASPGNPTGGLKVDPRVGTVPGIVWQGAELPSETVNPDGTYDVEIEQTASKAILTWERFDVGSLTTLKFDQPGQDSAVLNRVMDVKPSEIFGKITAPGQVLVINRNGILFTGTSQVNVGGLVASSLDIGLPYQTTAERNTYFLEPGNGTRSFSFAIADPESGEIVGKTYGSGVTGSFVPRAAPVEGNVEVQAGASITTAPLSNTNPYLGRVVLAAPRVINRGTIETPDGQTILVGARNFTLINNSAGAIDALKLSIPDSVVDGLNVDPDLRGAQVLAGADDYFTVRGTSADNILAGAVTTAGFLRLDVRGARDADGFFDAPLVDMPAARREQPGARALLQRRELRAGECGARQHHHHRAKDRPALEGGRLRRRAGRRAERRVERYHRRERQWFDLPGCPERRIPNAPGRDHTRGCGTGPRGHHARQRHRDRDAAGLPVPVGSAGHRRGCAVQHAADVALGRDFRSAVP